MINKILTWFKSKSPELDISSFSEVYQDLQIELENTKYEVKVLRDSLSLKQKEYDVLLVKYVELKVKKDIVAKNDTRRN